MQEIQISMREVQGKSKMRLIFDPSRLLISLFFLTNVTSKQVFHCTTQHAEFTGNSKVFDREIMISNSLEVQSLKCIEDRLLLSHLGITINIH